MQSTLTPQTHEVAESVEAKMTALAAPFAQTEVKFRAGVVSGQRALALAYVDARAVQDRLDDVLGCHNWQDEYDCLPDGTVICKLRIRLGDEWITKVDVGGPSEQPDGGDRAKAAFSDALKRAAVKFGIGRYLYRLPAQWHEYDPIKKRFPTPPRLNLSGQVQQSTPHKSTSAQTTPTKPKLPSSLPTTGSELQRRLVDFDANLAKQALCQQGDLLKYVLQAGLKVGYEADLAKWSGQAILFAVDHAKSYQATLLRAKQPNEKKEVA